MSGTDSSAPSRAAADPAPLLNFSVHSLPSPHEADAARRTARGRRLMFAVLAVCALPVVASYFSYFVVRPEGRSNYSDLVAPRAVPATLDLTDLQGRRVDASFLRSQWTIVVVAGGACAGRCERQLWLQRQLHETLGREKDRVDKLWLVDDGSVPRDQTLAAIGAGASPDASGGPGAARPPMRVLVAPRAALSSWLEPAPGRALEDHLYVVDPRGDWMMRVPVDPEPARLKRDIEKLLRASAGWDRAGR